MTCPGGKHKAGHRDLGHLLHDLGLATVGSSFPEVFSVFWATRHPCSPLAQHPTRCQDIQPWEFPGCPVVRTLPFHCRGHRFDRWWGNQGPASHTAKQTNKRYVNLPLSLSQWFSTSADLPPRDIWQRQDIFGCRSWKDVTGT